MKNDLEVKNQVLQAVMAAEVSKGHLKWKVSDIARQTKVSRPLIYYHFGKTKQEIFNVCLQLVAEDYYGLTPEREKSLVSGSLYDSVLRTWKMYKNNPSLAVFYQKARMSQSDLNDQMVEIESRYQKKLKKAFPHLSEHQIKAVHAIFHGLVTAPFIDEKSLDSALKMINWSVGEKK